MEWEFHWLTKRTRESQLILIKSWILYLELFFKEDIYTYRSFDIKCTTRRLCKWLTKANRRNKCQSTVKSGIQGLNGTNLESKRKKRKDPSASEKTQSIVSDQVVEVIGKNLRAKSMDYTYSRLTFQLVNILRDKKIKKVLFLYRMINIYCLSLITAEPLTPRNGSSERIMFQCFITSTYTAVVIVRGIILETSENKLFHHRPRLPISPLGVCFSLPAPADLEPESQPSQFIPSAMTFPPKCRQGKSMESLVFNEWQISFPAENRFLRSLSLQLAV